MKRLISIILFLSSISSFGAQVTDAFVVTIYDKYVRVTSPPRLKSKMSVIIDNRTLSTVYGKVVNEDKSFFESINVRQESSFSIRIDVKGRKKYYYIPLAPGFQKVELIAGKESYEIPAKR